MGEGLAILLLLWATTCRAVVINEVMSNPEGPESEVSDHNEFIELYNYGEDTDLSGFHLECGVSGGTREEILEWSGDFVAPDVITHTTLIPGGGYALILPPGYVDSSSHPQPYQFGEGAVILTIGTKSFGQSGLATTHHLWLFDSAARLIDTYGSPDDTGDGIPFDPGEGVSVERIDPTAPDTEANWSASLHESGCTPGMRNSVSRIYNLALLTEDISFFPSSPMVGGNCEILVQPRNLGRGWAKDFELLVYSDGNLDYEYQPEELIGRTTVVDSLEPLRGQASVSFLWSGLEEGDYSIVGEIHYALDEDTSDNSAQRFLRVGAPLPDVIINEIMCDPLSPQPQWLELHNRSSRTHELTGFTISDSDSASFYILPDLILNPGEYCVVAASTSDFGYPDVQILVQPTNGFPYLNKGEDIVFLRDVHGFIFESVHYFSAMGGAYGVSLERVSPQVSAGQSVNWGSSVDPAGASPGRRNSLWTGPPSVSGSLSPSPNPFFPNGDGIEDFTIISYSLPYALSKVKLTVYDIKGRQTRMLADGMLAASRGTLLWDGKDETGDLVPSGIYILYLEASDLETAGVFAKKSTVVLGRD